MSFEKLTPGSKAPDVFNVVIEISANSAPVKYEVDKDSGCVFVDRFLGTAMHYPVNYGYVEGVPGGDGAWLDAYVLGPTEPVARFVGQVAGVCYRRDDCEDKLVVIGPGPTPSAGEMAAAIQFQERYFDSHVETE